MTVEVKDLSSVKKELVFEVGAEAVAVEIEKAYKSFGRTAKLRGFRAGKVPRKVLEQHYAHQVSDRVLGQLINETYRKALVEHRIPAIAEPTVVEVSGVEKGKSLTFTAQVEIRPEVVASNYKGVEVKKELYVADAGIVDARLEEMRNSAAKLESSTRKVAREGDTVLIDFEGSVDGDTFAGGQAQDYSLELGSGSFIPGFEDQIVRMKRDQEKDVEVTFPESYGAKELAGRPAIFKVLLKDIKEKVLPELNDEFAKEAGLETLDELRAKIAEDFETQEKSRIDSDLRERLMTELLERNQIEVPEAMVAGQLDYMLANAKGRLQSQGMSMEMLGLTPESFNENYRDTAVKQVQGGLLLSAIAKQEGISVGDDEVASRLQEIADAHNVDLDTVKKSYSGNARQGLVAQMTEDKVLESLIAEAVVEEVSKDVLTPAVEEKE